MNDPGHCDVRRRRPNGGFVDTAAKLTFYSFAISDKTHGPKKDVSREPIFTAAQGAHREAGARKSVVIVTVSSGTGPSSRA